MRPSLSAAFEASREIDSLIADHFNGEIDFDVFKDEGVDDNDNPYVHIKSAEDLTKILPSSVQIRGGYNVTIIPQLIQKGRTL